MTKKFIKNKEDFVCENCADLVIGSGFTNHCPKCLWSKHVDVNPGDRKHKCGGLMTPIGYEMKSGDVVIIHRCISCGFLKKNKTAFNDNLETLLGRSSVVPAEF